jgi:hypothetical protein
VGPEGSRSALPSSKSLWGARPRYSVTRGRAVLPASTFGRVARWFDVHRSAEALRIPRRRRAVPSGVRRAVPSGFTSFPSPRWRDVGVPVGRVARWLDVHRSAEALRIPRRRRAVPSGRYRVGRCPSRCPNTSWDVGLELLSGARSVCGCVPVRERRVRHAHLPRSPSGSSDPRESALAADLARMPGGRPSYACTTLPAW